ncbi:MAG: SDR family oxidoreductase [Paracoccaceae bacterium]
MIHLAAISNDPMGNLFEGVTRNINFGASVRLAELAKAHGVRAFVFASSCSVYGGGSAYPKKESDTVEPLTAYAKSKIDTEIELRKLASEDFCVTVLRFATACGWSERFRTDLVLNDFVASAFVNGNVEILSDGQPFRPLICVKDMAKALAWGGQRDPKLGGEFLVVNCGSNDWNFRIKDLALAVSECIPNISVKFSSQTTVDKRSYQVDFSLYKELAPDCYPSQGLDKTIGEIWAGLSIMDSIDADYRNSKFMRLVHLKYLIESNQLNEDIKWVA